MTFRFVRLAAASVAFVACFAHAAEPVRIAPAVPYAPYVAEDARLAGCDWNRMLVYNIVKRGGGRVATTDTAPAATPGRYLALEVKHINVSNRAPSRHVISLHGDLLEGGKVLGSFKAERSTVMSKETACLTAKKIGTTLAKDVVAWLDANATASAADLAARQAALPAVDAPAEAAE